MFVANVANVVLSQTHLVATWLQAADTGSSVDLVAMFKSMGLLAKIVVGILFIMSGWSISAVPAAPRRGRRVGLSPAACRAGPGRRAASRGRLLRRSRAL